MDTLERFYNGNKEGLSIAEEAIDYVQKLENGSEVSAGAGEMDWSRSKGGIRTLGVGISTEFINKGYIDLRGKEVRSPRQLAVLAQVYRDPRFETLRFIYMRDNIIVGHEGITSKLPASAVAFMNLPDKENCRSEKEFSQKVRTAQVRFFIDISYRMERLKADGYFLLHNHPSAVDVSPSQDDLSMTVMYKKALSGFMGHIIIDSNKYSFIDEGLHVDTFFLDLGKDKLITSSVPHQMLGQYIDSSNKLASISKQVQIDMNYSVVIYVSAKNEIRAIQEIPNGLFNKETECVDFLRGRMREFGSSRAFVVTESQSVKEIACDMVKKGYLLDAIITASNFSVTSVRESGIEPSQVNDIYWMGRKTNRGFKVRERDGSKYKYNLNEMKPAGNMKSKNNQTYGIHM